MAIAPLFALALLAAQVEGGASASVTSQIGPAETSNDTTVVEPGVFIGGALSLSVEDWKREVLMQDDLFFRLYSDLPKELIFQRELLISRL